MDNMPQPGEDGVFLAYNSNGDAAYVLKNLRGDAEAVEILENGCFRAAKGTALHIKCENAGSVITGREGYRTYYSPAYRLKVGDQYLIPNGEEDILELEDTDEGFWFYNTDYYGRAAFTYRYSLTDGENAENDRVLFLNISALSTKISITDPDKVTNETPYAQIGCIVCAHENMTHYEKQEASCSKSGRKEYYQCNDCGNLYLDEDGTRQVYSLRELSINPKNHYDKNSDGYCDDCGKLMGVFKKVTDKSEIVQGNKYIVVSDRSGTPYSMKKVPASREMYDWIPSVNLIYDAEGNIPYTAALNDGAMIFNLKYIFDYIGWEDGGMRFGFHFDDGDDSLLLSYDFEVSDAAYAKYGYHITVKDGDLKISDGYAETWTEEDAYLRMNDGKFAMHKEEGVAEYPVSLYRYVQNGIFEGVSYEVTDEMLAANFSNIAGADSVATAATAVSGVSSAISKEKLEEIVSGLKGEKTEMSLHTGVKVEAESDGEDGIVYDLTPVAYADDDVENCVEIADEDFNGMPMSVFLYTGGVSPATVIHTKNDGTEDIYYQEWTDKPLTFSRGMDDKGNEYVSFEVTEFSAIRVLPYDLSLPEYYIYASVYDMDERIISQFPQNEAFQVVSHVNEQRPYDGDAVVILAVYDEDGALIHFDFAPLGPDEEYKFIVPAQEAKIKSFKSFVWESLGSVHPLSEICEIG